MPARRKKTTRAKKASLINKDLFVFIIIVAVVAVVTYVLTYNAIIAKLDQQMGMPSSYMAPAQ